MDDRKLRGGTFLSCMEPIPFFPPVFFFFFFFSFFFPFSKLPVPGCHQPLLFRLPGKKTKVFLSGPTRPRSWASFLPRRPKDICQGISVFQKKFRFFVVRVAKWRLVETQPYLLGRFPGPLVFFFCTSLMFVLRSLITGRPFF